MSKNLIVMMFSVLFGILTGILCQYYLQSYVWPIPYWAPIFWIPAIYNVIMRRNYDEIVYPIIMTDFLFPFICAGFITIYTVQYLL